MKKFLPVLAILVVVALLSSSGVVKLTIKSTPDAPVPIYSDPPGTVDVINNVNGVKYPGYGVAVDYESTKFVITSRLVLFAGTGDLTVNGSKAIVIAEDTESELIALSIEDDLPTVLLTPQVWGGEITVFTDVPKVVTKGQYLRHWSILRNAPERATGAAVFADGDLIGVVIGNNRANPNDAIVADSTLLINLAETVEQR